MSSLCDECTQEHLRWLDYPMPPASMPLIQIGNPSERRISDVRSARAQDWRTTIRTAQDLIRTVCLEQHTPAQEG